MKIVQLHYLRLGIPLNAMKDPNQNKNFITTKINYGSEGVPNNFLILLKVVFRINNSSRLKLDY